MTKDLVDIRSESAGDGEGEVSKYISTYLKEIGIKSKTISFGKHRSNVVVEIGEGEGLMLNGHTDTVPIGDPSKWKYGTSAHIANGRVYGRGASDMKGGIAAILAALETASLREPKRRLLLAFVGDEERNLEGSRCLLSRYKSLFNGVRWGVIAEPTDLHICIAQKGIVEFSITVTGKAAHSSQPWLGRNAITDTAKAIDALSMLQSQFKTHDRVLGSGTINIGRISGGIAANVVPEKCKFEADRRLVPGEDAHTAINQIKVALKRLPIYYKMRVTVSQMPYSLPRNSFIARYLKSLTGREFAGVYGYTEARLYKDIADIDCAVFGPGTLKGIHGPNEFVRVSDLEKGTMYYSRIINQWLMG